MLTSCAVSFSQCQASPEGRNYTSAFFAVPLKHLVSTKCSSPCQWWWWIKHFLWRQPQLCCFVNRSFAYYTQKHSTSYKAHIFCSLGLLPSISVSYRLSPLHPFSICLSILLISIPVLCSKFQSLLCYDDNVNFVIVHKSANQSNALFIQHRQEMRCST